jgi:molybdopterin molybdotransferase
MGKPQMLTIDEAYRAVVERAKPLPPTRTGLDSALGLVLAEDVTADIDLPPFDKSTVDGFAVRPEDAVGPGPHHFSIGEEIPAGHASIRPLAHREAAMIMTGAPLPEGAGAVVMIEDTERDDHGIIVRRSVTPGQNRMSRGRETRSGEVVAKAGDLLTPARMGVLASVGCVEPFVVPRPIVRVVPTGDELVQPAYYPVSGQIRESNATMLSALVRDHGAEAVAHPIARDEIEPLKDALRIGLEYDLVLITGGVSAGNRDLVPAALESLGVVRVFHKIRLKPGKPLWFGIGPDRFRRPGALVFGLPGNPVSGLVGFLLFASPALAALAGREPRQPKLMAGHLTTSFTHRGERTTYHPAILENDCAIRPLDWAGSGDLRTVAQADGFAVFAAGDHQYSPGDSIQFLPLRNR